MNAFTPPTILHTGQLAQSHCVKALVYGKAGAGKTFLSTTAPAPLVLSAESGLLSIKRFNVPYIPVTGLVELNNLYNWLAGSAEARNFATVYMDSISEYAEVSLIHEKTLAGKDPRKAYGAMADSMIALIRKFRDLPTHHVVMVAKQEYKKDDSTGAMIYGPSFPGQQLTQQVPYFFDEVWHLWVYTDPQTQQKYRLLRTAPDNQFEAKDRSGVLAENEPAHIGHVFNKMLGA